VLFWAVKQRVVVIPYRRFRTTYQSNIQRVKNSRTTHKTNRTQLGLHLTLLCTLDMAIAYS